MRKTGKKPELSEVQKDASAAKPERFDEWLDDSYLRNKERMPHFVHTKFDRPELGIRSGDALFIDVTAVPKVGQVVAVECDNGKLAIETYKPQIKLATANGKKVESFKPFQKVFGVVRFIGRQISEAVQ